MKSKLPVGDPGVLPRETPARQAARIRKLRLLLRQGLGLSALELRDSLWPGYVETFRAENDYRVTEPGSPYGRLGSR